MTNTGKTAIKAPRRRRVNPRVALMSNRWESGRRSSHNVLEERRIKRPAIDMQLPARIIRKKLILVTPSGAFIFWASTAGKKKTLKADNSLEGLAADEGFEPSQTESESGVLPLH